MAEQINVTKTTKHGDVTFKMIKNIIIKENKDLLYKLAKYYALDYNELEQKYLRPEYYLPIVLKDTPPKDGQNK